MNNARERCGRNDTKKLDHFPNCEKAVEEAGINFHWKNDKMRDILIQLQTQFSDRFVDFEKVSSKLKIFANPFSCDIEDVQSHLQMNVIDLQSNDALKSSFYSIKDLVKFYGSLPSDFDELKRKNKYASRLTNEHLRAILRIATTNMTANIQEIASQIQPQTSH
ncbi:hypothetical protein ACJJTC_016039 [Scirpophaga incertulas]